MTTDPIERELKQFFIKLALNFKNGEALAIECDFDRGLVTVQSLDNKKKKLRIRLSPQATIVLYNLLNNGITVELDKHMVKRRRRRRRV